MLFNTRPASGVCLLTTISLQFLTKFSNLQTKLFANMMLYPSVKKGVLNLTFLSLSSLDSTTNTEFHNLSCERIVGVLRLKSY